MIDFHQIFIGSASLQDDELIRFGIQKVTAYLIQWLLKPYLGHSVSNCGKIAFSGFALLDFLQSGGGMQSLTLLVDF